MIVELIGVPGSGKTTLAGRIVDTLVARGVVATSADDARTVVADQVARGRWAVTRRASPGLWATSLRLRLLTRGVDEQVPLRQLRRCDAALRAARPDGVIVVHEGSFHRLCLILARAGRTDDRSVDRFVGHMARPDALVHLRFPSYVVHARARVRLVGLGFESELAEVENEAWMAWRTAYQAAADRVVGTVACELPVLRVDDTEADVGLLSESVAGWIEAMLGADGVGQPAGVTQVARRGA